MLSLALDTCDARGSIALLRDANVIAVEPHPADEEYSSWLLPAVDRLLGSNNISHSNLMGYAVASGPGSFTGVRVGLTTAKAWAEVYGKPVYPVSRLTILAERAPSDSDYVATFIDAQRKQVFGALYRRLEKDLELIGEEQVIDPEGFFERATNTAGSAAVTWVSLDSNILKESSFWMTRVGRGEAIINVDPPLAAQVGLYAMREMKRRPGVDALALDANYVRRSDAEIFGKKAAVT